MSYQANVKPKKGDILRVRRNLGYYHFGIYVGHDKVVHFTGNGTDSIFDNTNINIYKTSLDNFVRGDILEVNTPYDSKYHRFRVVFRASRQVGNHYFRKRLYDLLTNNCEHFASFCYYGEAISNQSLHMLDGGAKSAFVKLGVKVFNSISQSVSKKEHNETKEVKEIDIKPSKKTKKGKKGE